MTQKVFYSIISLCIALNGFAGADGPDEARAFAEMRAQVYAAADRTYLGTLAADRLALGKEYTNDGITIAPHRALENPSTTLKVLILSGGGARGIFPILFLIEMERLAGRSVADIFDLVAGSSAGGIIALALTQPSADGRVSARSAASLEEIFIDFVGAVFPPDTFWSMISLFSGCKYPSGPIEARLANLFGASKLSLCRTPTLITAVDAEAHAPRHFRSHRARHDSSCDFHLAAAGRATGAAPLLFTPAQVSSIAEGSRSLFLIDGGVAAKNPSLLAVQEARDLFGRERRMHVVSLGTGLMCEKSRGTYPQSFFGLVDRLMDLLFDSHHSLAETVLRSDPDVIFDLFDMNLPDKLLSTAPSTGNMGALMAAGRAMVDMHRAKLEQLVQRLIAAKPETDFERAKREVSNRAAADAERDAVTSMIGKASGKGIEIGAESAAGEEGVPAPASEPERGCPSASAPYSLDPTVVAAAREMGADTGRSAARQKVAEAMLNKSSSVEDIMDVTGLSKYMVESLRDARLSILHQRI